MCPKWFLSEGLGHVCNCLGGNGVGTWKLWPWDAVATPLKAGSTAMAPSKGVGDKVVASSPGRPSSVGSKQLGLPVSGQCQQIL